LVIGNWGLGMGEVWSKIARRGAPRTRLNEIPTAWSHLTKRPSIQAEAQENCRGRPMALILLAVVWTS